MTDHDANGRASSQNDGEASDQRDRAAAQDQKHSVMREIYNMHDTPPPLIFGDGSTFIESEDNLLADIAGGNGTPRIHKRYPKNGKNRAYMHAIRVLLGNGETPADGYFHPISDKAGCRIDIVFEDGAMIQIAGGAYFSVRTDADKQLVRTGTPKGAKRNHIYKHVGNDVNSPGRRMQRVTVTDGAKHYDHELGTLPSRGNELQLMIWIEDVDA